MYKRLRLYRRLLVVITLVSLFIIGMMKVAIEVEKENVKYIDRIHTEVVEIEKIVSQPAPFEYEDMGTFKVSFYTAGYESTGKRPGDRGYGITKSGAMASKGITLAVDPNVIPLGTYIYIEGIGFGVAQDTGGAIKGNKIDVYVDDVNYAYQMGIKNAKVYRLGSGI